MKELRQRILSVLVTVLDAGPARVNGFTALPSGTADLRSSILLRPPLSLNGLRSGRGPLCSLDSSLIRAGSDFSSCHHRYGPPAFPKRSRNDWPGTAMEIYRFPRQKLLRMPGGSTEDAGSDVSRVIETGRPLLPSWTEKNQQPELLTPCNTSPAPPCETLQRLPSRTTRDHSGRYGSLLLHRERDVHRRLVDALPAPRPKHHSGLLHPKQDHPLSDHFIGEREHHRECRRLAITIFECRCFTRPAVG